MRFPEFQRLFRGHSIIDIRNVENQAGLLDRRRLFEWQKKGYLKKLTSNFYMFEEAELTPVLLCMAANRVHFPSYVGLEYALQWYGLIPEQVYQVTSITTLKTRRISNALLNFRYSHVKPGLYWGMVPVEKNGHTFLISSPEKTIIDYLYFHPRLHTPADFKELRINTTVLKDLLEPARMARYLALLGGSRLGESVNRFMDYHHA